MFKFITIITQQYLKWRDKLQQLWEFHSTSRRLRPLFASGNKCINAMVLAGFEPTASRTLKIFSNHWAIEADGVSRFSSQVFFTQREWARIDMRDNFTYKKYQTCNIMRLISLYL